MNAWSQDGAYIRGLFLEGARWDPEQRSLNDSRPKQLYTPLPVLHLDPEQHRKNPDKAVYRCPVYKVGTNDYDPLDGIQRADGFITTRIFF